MKRVIAFGGVVGGLLTLLVLAACSTQDGPTLGTLVVDVSPDSAHITVMSGADLVDYGYGDVELSNLEPGTYNVTAGHGSYLYTASIDVRARERLTATIQLGEPSTMQLAYQHRPFYGPTLSLLRHGEPGPGDDAHGNSGGKGGKGSLYGDLWIIERNADGTPVTEEITSADGTATLDCVIPLDVDGNQIHLIVATDGPTPKCELAEEDLDLVQEVEFGRLNLVRAPSKVLDKAYDEAMATLTASEDPITVDPAGRLVATIDGNEQAIDSPLENVALYRYLIDHGNALDTSGWPGGSAAYATWNWLDVAAALFAAGADKTGLIDIDEVVYINDFLGLNVDTYVHYAGYSYSRLARYAGVEATLLLPDDPNDPNSTYSIQTVNVLGYALPNEALTGTNVDGFAKAANDALQVIEYIHAYAVPETPTP